MSAKVTVTRSLASKPGVCYVKKARQARRRSKCKCHVRDKSKNPEPRQELCGLHLGKARDYCSLPYRITDQRFRFK